MNAVWSTRVIVPGLLGVAVVLALLLAGVAVVSGWAGWDEPVRVWVDGEQVWGEPHGDSLSFGESIALVGGLVLALLVTLVVVPLTLAVCLAAAALAIVLALVLGLGLPVLILLGLGALLLSPLILLGWLVVKMLR